MSGDKKTDIRDLPEKKVDSTKADQVKGGTTTTPPTKKGGH
jgi:hypothetical protein